MVEGIQSLKVLSGRHVHFDSCTSDDRRKKTARSGDAEVFNLHVFSSIRSRSNSSTGSLDVVTKSGFR